MHLAAKLSVLALATFVGAVGHAADRDDATLGAVCAAIAGGVDVVRVHDVGRVKDAVIVADAIRRAATARSR